MDDKIIKKIHKMLKAEIKAWDNVKINSKEERILKKLAFSRLYKAGIITKSGKLSKHYK